MAKNEKTEQVSEDTNPKVKATPAEQKSLFEAHDKVLTEEKELEAKLEQVHAKKNNCIKNIYETMGDGPFKWKGAILNITKRGEIYYFRGRREEEPLEIG